MSDKVKPYHPFYPYLRWESNPNLKFRKLPFYPLNYRGKQDFTYSGAKIVLFCLSLQQ